MSNNWNSDAAKMRDWSDAEQFMAYKDSVDPALAVAISKEQFVRGIQSEGFLHHHEDRWDAVIDYVRWDIVKPAERPINLAEDDDTIDRNGLYLAHMNPPVGTLLDNTDYWINLLSGTASAPEAVPEPEPAIAMNQWKQVGILHTDFQYWNTKTLDQQIDLATLTDFGLSYQAYTSWSNSIPFHQEFFHIPHYLVAITPDNEATTRDNTRTLYIHSSRYSAGYVKRTNAAVIFDTNENQTFLCNILANAEGLIDQITILGADYQVGVLRIFYR